MNRIFWYFFILFLSLFQISIGFAQDNTQVSLPAGAITRLGKGDIIVKPIICTAIGN